MADLSLEQQTEIPFVRFVLNRAAIARYGLRVQDVADAIETSFAGTMVGRVFDRAAAFDLVVKLDPAAAVDFERIADLPVHTPTGETVPIRVLADVRREMGPNMILRENVQRRIVVSCNISGRDLGSVVDDIQAAVAQQVPMPDGYRVEYGGQFESQQSATEHLADARRRGHCRPVHDAGARVRSRARRVADHAQPAAGADRRRRRRVPGGRRAERGVDHRVHHAVRHRDAERHHARLAHPPSDGVEGVTNFREAVERGAHERLIPILMTAMAAGLALIPLAMRGGESGSEIQTPMAIVILCGLTTSTLLNMFVVPTLYLKYGVKSATSSPSQAR